MTIQPGANVYTQGFGSRPESVEVPHIDVRAPTSSDVIYPIGKRWIYAGNADYTLVELSTSGGITTATWVLLGTDTGALNTLTGNTGGALSPSAGNINIIGSGVITVTGSGSTLTVSETPGTGLVATLTGDSGGAIGPTSGNINLFGTTNEIVTTGTAASEKIVWTISSTLVLPGTFTANAGTALINTTGNASTTIGNTSGSGAVTLNAPSGNLAINGDGNTISIAGDSAASTLDLGTGTTGTISMGSSSAGNTTITNGSSATFAIVGSGGTVDLAADANANTINLGSTSAGTVTIAAGTALDLQGAAATTILIGAAAQTGNITLGSSTATSSVLIANGSGTNTVSINNAASNSHACAVNILAGATPAASQTVAIMTGSNSAGTQSCTIGSTSQTANTIVLNVGNSAGLVVNCAAKANAITLTSGGGTYWGTQSNTAPAAGFLGQQVRATVVQGSAVSLTTATPANVTSISLTAGIWDVTGLIMLTGGAVTGTIFQASVNTTSATLGTLGDNQVEGASLPTAAADVTLTIPAYRISLNATTTVYLVAEATFTVGSPAAYGRISATRVG